MLRIWTCQLQSYPSSYHPHGMCNRCLFLSDRNIYLRVYLRNSISQSSPNPIQLLPSLNRANFPTPLSRRERERERKGREKSLIFSFRLIFESRNPRFRFRLRTPGSHDYSRKHARARRDKSISSDFLEVHHRASYFPSATPHSFESADHKMYHLLVCTPRVKLDFIGTVIHSTLPSESTSGRSNHDSSSSLFLSSSSFAPNGAKFESIPTKRRMRSIGTVARIPKANHSFLRAKKRNPSVSFILLFSPETSFSRRAKRRDLERSQSRNRGWRKIGWKEG